MNVHDLRTSQFDPQFYVVAVPGGYAIIPFELYQTVGKILRPYRGKVWTADEVVSAVRDVDISLVFDPEMWAIRWMPGSTLTVDMLNRILVCEQPSQYKQ